MEVRSVDNKLIRQAFLLLAAAFLAIQISSIMNRPAESARSYRYKVVSVGAMTELKTQADTDQNRRVAIENLINQEAAGGWEFMQADGYVLYFRR